jgi:8-oxo-dGTP diphosphatase
MEQEKRYPKVSVKVILKWEGKILMFKHPSGIHDLPGGTVEWGEPVLDALRRELREELAYELEGEPELFRVYDDWAPEKDRHRIQLQYIYKPEMEPEIISLEKVDYCWLDKEEARLIFGDRKMLDGIFD